MTAFGKDNGIGSAAAYLAREHQVVRLTEVAFFLNLVAYFHGSSRGDEAPLNAFVP